MRPRAEEKPYFCFWFLFVIYLAKREENHKTPVRATQEIESFIRKTVWGVRSQKQRGGGAVFLPLRSASGSLKHTLFPERRCPGGFRKRCQRSSSRTVAFAQEGGGWGTSPRFQDAVRKML